MWQAIKKFFASIERLNRQKAVEDLEWQVHELQHIFALLTLGALIGQPGAPLSVILALLPDMEEEFAVMLAKIQTSHAPLSDHFSRLDAV